MVSHLWLLGCQKSACLFSRVFKNAERMHCSFDAALSSPAECCFIRFSCDTSFQRCFTCAFSLLPTLCVHHQVSIVSPLPHTISALPYSPNLRVLQTTAHIFTTHNGGKEKTDFLKKDIMFIKGFKYFAEHFFSEVSPCLFILLVIRIYALFALWIFEAIFFPVD